MKKVILTVILILLAAGIMFYVLVENATRSTHMHFTNQGGTLRKVVYYSAKPPETAAEHTCDGKFADMADHLYATHVRLWQEKYGVREEQLPEKVLPQEY